jgi:hypothetical protein
MLNHTVNSNSSHADFVSLLNEDETRITID